MGRVSKYKKLNSSDSIESDKHDDGFEKVCKSRLFVSTSTITILCC